MPSRTPDWKDYRIIGIKTDDKKHFNEVMKLLFELGFVYSYKRLRTLKDIRKEFPYLPYILIGNCLNGCKMELDGSVYDHAVERDITVHSFIKNYWPKYKRLPSI